MRHSSAAWPATACGPSIITVLRAVSISPAASAISARCWTISPVNRAPSILSSRVAWTSVDTACMKAMYVARRFSMRLPNAPAHVIDMQPRAGLFLRLIQLLALAARRYSRLPGRTPQRQGGAEASANDA
ncbi:hypothetical protein ACSCB1_26280 [Streptomyces europaeiscabiei]|uniref:hypothetical protein n=1 Tax=Streptomyces europaeiscabiei TaxID=146819 RepID=UPI0006285B69|nr:hypothetical protein [Streptomyces europaeiscabiei]MDX2763048.1 hypothetical protein [Streptomyces europaeiscabiei]MDX3836617.1 hypothetical protein [Streptomyces europaeiscabiei]